MVKKIGFEVNLAVGNGNHVRRNVSRYVTSLRFDNRQRRERSTARLLGHPRTALEQPRVQVKHIARVGFAAGRTLEYERNLTICHRVFGKIIKDNERVHAVIHKPLAHGGAGKWSQILVGSRVRRRRGDDGGVRHRAFLLQHGEGAGDVGVFLPDGDVNTIKRSIIL